MSDKSNGSKSTVDAGRTETRFKAKAVSRGLAVGRVVCLVGRKRQYYRNYISPDAVAQEIRRVKTAFRLAQNQLKKLARPDSRSNGPTGRSIFATQAVILKESGLLTKITETIESDLINAEWAVGQIFDEYVTKFRALEDEHIREKYLDIEDISERIMTALGSEKYPTGLDEGSVIVAKELRPSTVVELHSSRPSALITEHGGWTSHSFILARELNIPAVTGLKKALRKFRSGDRVIVDGYEGNVVLNPSLTTEEELLKTEYVRKPAGSTQERHLEPIVHTLDGHPIDILINADLPVFPNELLGEPGFGIGLFRTEYLFNRYGGFPTENQQYSAYRSLAQRSGPAGIKIRTFDIDVGQLVDTTEDREVNPALGLRGIRLGLSYPRELSVQIRALLRASAGNSVDIVLPMVSGVSDVRQCRDLIEKERDALLSKGIAIGDPGIGAMVEIPATVFAIDEVLEEVDFVCLGTNDLTQYILAADRDNETIANWYRTLHPAVIKAVKTVIKAGIKAEKPVIICGEMAGSPFYLPVLVGLGARYLSMNANSISRISQMISGIARAEAAELVARLEKIRTADEIESEVRSTISLSWPHLFPDDLIR